MPRATNALDEMLNEMLGKPKQKRVRSRGFRCAECDAKLTRDQYRESVHCNPCLEQMDLYLAQKYGRS
jgi:uncharacterized CHY-type Zn-finger protein